MGVDDFSVNRVFENSENKGHIRKVLKGTGILLAGGTAFAFITLNLDREFNMVGGFVEDIFTASPEHGGVNKHKYDPDASCGVRDATPVVVVKDGVQLAALDMSLSENFTNDAAGIQGKDVCFYALEGEKGTTYHYASTTTPERAFDNF